MNRTRNSIDIYVGMRLRQQRNSLQISREALADHLEVSTAYIEECELGLRRIGSSRLIALASFLEVPLGFFFDNLPQAIADSAATTPNDITAHADDAEATPSSGEEDRRVTELVEAFYGIEEIALRNKLLDFMRSLHKARSHVFVGDNVIDMNKSLILKTKDRLQRSGTLRGQSD